MKKIFVRNRNNLNNLLAGVKLGRFICISITDFSEAFSPYIPNNKDCLGVLAIRFNDFEESSHSNEIICTEKTGILIAYFIAQHWDQADSVIINCDAGISRSAGVAVAIAEYYGKSAVDINTTQLCWMPNSTVKKYTLNGLKSYYSN